MKTVIIFILSINICFGQSMFNFSKHPVTDYDAHYVVSANISSFFAASAYYITKRPLISGLIGIGASFLVGMGKEYIYDGMMHKGTKSNLDLEADAKGSANGGLLSFAIIDTMDKRKQKIDSLKYQNLAIYGFD